MTDKELLELAAKAVGIEGRYSDNILTDGGQVAGIELVFRRTAPPQGAHSHSIMRCWNPLMDDGDALRLAVNLRIDVRPRCPDAAATRCAIVHAAAAIGEQMP